MAKIERHVWFDGCLHQTEESSDVNYIIEYDYAGPSANSFGYVLDVARSEHDAMRGIGLNGSVADVQAEGCAITKFTFARLTDGWLVDAQQVEGWRSQKPGKIITAMMDKDHYQKLLRKRR